MIFFLEIQCKDPDSINGISVQVSTHSIGGVAHYSCPRGHNMQGNSTRICLKEGTWSGRAPTCIREYYQLFRNIKKKSK